MLPVTEEDTKFEKRVPAAPSLSGRAHGKHRMRVGVFVGANPEEGGGNSLRTAILSALETLSQSASIYCVESKQQH